MTDSNTEGLFSGHDRIRTSDFPPDTPSPAPDAAKELVIKPLDQIAPREHDEGTSRPMNQFARTFRLSLRNSFNELLRPLQTLAPEHEVIPSWIGGGYDVLRCGHCDFAIAECVDIEQMRRQTLYCPRCTAENQVP